jgi:hypothetical protein
MPHGAMADGVVWRCSHATLQVDHLILTLLLRWFQIHLNSSNTRTRGTRRHGRNNRGKLASTGAVVGTIRHACQIGLGNAIILGWDKTFSPPPPACLVSSFQTHRSSPPAAHRTCLCLACDNVYYYCFFFFSKQWWGMNADWKIGSMSEEHPIPVSMACLVSSLLYSAGCGASRRRLIDYTLSSAASAYLASFPYIQKYKYDK